MRYTTLLLVFFLLLNAAQLPAQPDADNTIAITNVHVIPMTQEGEILKHQTVVIVNGKIDKISTAKPRPNVTIVDGTGMYLIPGLTEMHAHIPVPGDGDETLVKETLFLYLSQGVTTIRGMLGNPYHLNLKDKVKSGEILGPRIYTSSPSLNGNSIKTPEEARTKITQYKKDGYDFLKIHPGIKLNVWEQVERTATEVGIPYAGHVPVDVGIRRALNAGYATVDHLDGFVEGLVPASVGVAPDANGFFGYNFTDIVDKNIIKELIQMTLKNNVGVVPTQTLFTRWFSPTDPNLMMEEVEMKYMPSETRYSWRQNKTRMINDESYDADKWKRFIEIRKSILAQMDKAGVTFLLGSDAPQVMNVPGFSLHHEMKDMADAGISNYKILESGTVNPAVFFGAEGAYGTIEAGASADLILINQNPLDDIRHASRIEGVFIGGVYLSKKIIDQKLKEIALRNE